MRGERGREEGEKEELTKLNIQKDVPTVCKRSHKMTQLSTFSFPKSSF